MMIVLMTVASLAQTVYDAPLMPGDLERCVLVQQLEVTRARDVRLTASHLALEIGPRPKNSKKRESYADAIDNMWVRVTAQRANVRSAESDLRAFEGVHAGEYRQLTVYECEGILDKHFDSLPE